MLELTNRHYWLLLWCFATTFFVGSVFFFASESTWRVGQTTFCLGITAALGAVPVGFILAWSQFRSSSKLTAILFTLIVGFALVPLHLQVAGWDAAFGKLGFLRGANGGQFKPLLTGFWAAAFIHFVASVPWVALIGAVWLRLFGGEAEEAALLDGGRWQVFLRVTLVKWIPVVGTATVWVTVMSAREIAATDIYQVGTIAEEVYLQASGGRIDWFGIDPMIEGEARGVNELLWLLLIGLWLTLSVVVCLTTLFPARAFTELFRRRTRQPKRWLDVVALVVFLSLFAFPFANLFIRAGSIAAGGESTELRFSFSHAVTEMFHAPSAFASELSWSAMIGALTAVCCVLVGTVVSLWVRDRRWAGVIVIFAVAMSFAIPGPFVGAAINSLSAKSDVFFLNYLFDRTVFGPTLATFLVAFGPVTLLLLFASRNIGRDTIEAVALDGGSRSGFSLPTLQQMLPAILASFVVSFLIGFSDLSASYLPCPAGIDTIPRRILGQMHAGVNDRTAALCLDLLFLIGTICGIGMWCFSSLRKREKAKTA